ncbi:MAG UNVERIFIED_CONTAM: hypothetical protein LVR18_14735 [Planctomycetaceae bacterium]
MDEDACPLRMTSPLQRILKETVTVTGTQFLDAQALMSAGCRGGIAGEQRLVDHVHPSFRGHEDLAVAACRMDAVTGPAANCSKRLATARPGTLPGGRAATGRHLLPAGTSPSAGLEKLGGRQSDFAGYGTVTIAANHGRERAVETKPPPRDLKF